MSDVMLTEEDLKRVTADCFGAESDDVARPTVLDHAIAHAAAKKALEAVAADLEGQERVAGLANGVLFAQRIREMLQELEGRE